MTVRRDESGFRYDSLDDAFAKAAKAQRDDFNEEAYADKSLKALGRFMDQNEMDGKAVFTCIVNKDEVCFERESVAGKWDRLVNDDFEKTQDTGMATKADEIRSNLESGRWKFVQFGDSYSVMDTTDNHTISKSVLDKDYDGWAISKDKNDNWYLSKTISENKEVIKLYPHKEMKMYVNDREIPKDKIPDTICRIDRVGKYGRTNAEEKKEDAKETLKKDSISFVKREIPASIQRAVQSGGSILEAIMNTGIQYVKRGAEVR